MDSINENRNVHDFISLLEENHIEIPIIQRDYAQGRKDKTEIRLEFLKALKQALISKKVICLDFIYGSIDNQVLQPLDGQQRLTTLFLLHYYALIQSEEESSVEREILMKFRYETRTSSREFCTALISNEVKIQRYERISDVIKDKPWYFLSWRKDPSIVAMLRTLDDIQNIFQDIPNIKELLFGDEKYIIFYYIELKNFGLSDDLYIKMNARGKSLTSFENFKASFEKVIIDNSWEEHNLLVDTFAQKVDTTWTELLWMHRNNNNVDLAFMRLFATSLMIQISLEKNQDRVSRLQSIQRDSNTIKPSEFTKFGFDYFSKMMDVYVSFSREQCDLKLSIPFWQHLSNSDVFKTIVSATSNPSYTQRVLFFAQTEYLLKVEKFDKVKFNDWMRVIRNFVSLGAIAKTGSRPAIVRSPEAFDSMINLVKELSEGCADIHNFMTTIQPKTLIAKDQLEEERVKSTLIINQPDLKKNIVKAEDLNLLMGRISIILDSMEYDGIPVNFDAQLFENYIKVFNDYFNQDVNDDLRRALLCIPDNEGKHNYYDYWWSYSYIVESEKRCLIQKYRELEYFIYGTYKERVHFKKYFVKLLKQLLNKTMDQIIDEFKRPESMPTWKYRLIKEPELLSKYCASKHIAIKPDNSGVYLLKGVRPRTMDGLYLVSNESKDIV